MIACYLACMKLDLQDLRPAEAELELSEKPGKKYTLKKMSLAVQIWVNQRFGKDQIAAIFENTQIPELTEITHHLLKDKTDFPTLESFQECIVTQQDRINIIKAMLHVVGISQPVIDKLSRDESQGNAPSPV